MDVTSWIIVSAIVSYILLAIVWFYFVSNTKKNPLILKIMSKLFNDLGMGLFISGLVLLAVENEQKFAGAFITLIGFGFYGTSIYFQRRYDNFESSIDKNKT